MGRNQADIVILGVETSCDETSAAIVKNGGQILSNVVLSQIDDHALFGGVIPEMASRKHLEAIIPVVDEALRKSGAVLDDIDAVAVTYGPGLVGALLVGLSFAKGLARAKNIPMIGVHHIAAHVMAASLTHGELSSPPFTALIASGGHSSIYHVQNYRAFKIAGRTRDDAAGEAFDKVARATGLGYPGGQKLESEAVGGNPDFIHFPRTAFKDGTFDFSFSGVKTAAVNYLMKNASVAMKDFYASYQAAVNDALVANTLGAELAAKTGKIVVAGGVAANGDLRRRFMKAAEQNRDGRIKVLFPEPALCTDNAAMVAAMAYHSYIAGDFSPLTLNAQPNATL